MEELRHMATRDEPRPTQREWSPSGSLDPVSISRTHKRIGFMGGIRGTAQLEKLVGSRQFAVGFSMRATSVDQLMAISDAGQIMPPKSTWFEPKLHSGLFILTF